MRAEIQTLVYAVLLIIGFMLGNQTGQHDARTEMVELTRAFIASMPDDEALCSTDESCSYLCRLEGLDADCWAEASR